MFDAIRFGIFGAIAVIVGRVAYFCIMATFSLIIGLIGFGILIALLFAIGKMV